MAFSTPQRDLIRTYLGYSSKFFQVDSVLEQAMDNLGNDADASATVISLLGRCQDIDTKLVAADNRQKYVSIEGNELKYAGPREIAMLR